MLTCKLTPLNHWTLFITLLSMCSSSDLSDSIPVSISFSIVSYWAWMFLSELAKHSFKVAFIDYFLECLQEFAIYFLLFISPLTATRMSQQNFENSLLIDSNGLQQDHTKIVKRKFNKTEQNKLIMTCVYFFTGVFESFNLLIRFSLICSNSILSDSTLMTISFSTVSNWFLIFSE